MRKAEYLKLTKDFKELSIKRKYAESEHDFDLVEFLDNKMTAILKQIDNADINFKTAAGL